jgi:predicted nucleotidyltransferase
MKKKLPQKIKTILAEIKQRLIEIYGDKLKDIILYGSFARGDFVEGSDIDIVILLEEMKDHISERETYFDAIWELGLKYDTVISIVPIKEEEYKTRKLPLILNVKREGIAV